MSHGGGGKDLFGAVGGGAVLVEEQLCVLLAGKKARGNGVDPDAHLAEVHRQPLGKVGHSSLGAGVGRDLGQGQVGVHAGNVQNVAALAPYHLPCKGLRGQQRADKVQVEHHLHAALVQIKKGDGVAFQIGHLKIFLVRIGAGVVAACTIHKDIAGAKVCQHILGYLQTVGLVHHVAGVALGGAAFGLDLVRKLLELIHVAAQQRHLCARPGQRLGKNGAQRAACAGDDSHLAGEIGVQYILFHNILLLQLYSLARV